MKYFIIFAALIAGISATALEPTNESLQQERFVDNIVNRIVANVSQTILDEGLDPLYIKREARQFALSVPSIFRAYGVIEDVLVTGLSDIRILTLNFSVLTLRLTYAFEIPHIHISTTHSTVGIAGFGEEINAEIAGKVDIYGGRASGTLRVFVGTSELQLRELDINISVRSIDSNVTTLQVYIYDLVDRANELIGTTIPGWIVDFSDEISTFLEIMLWDVIERALNEFN